MKKKNFQIGALIIVLLLIAIALVFIFIKYEPSFSPTLEPKITDIISSINSSPSQYTIVIPNDASSNLISSTSDFASSYGEFQQTKKHSEINTATSTKLIYLKIDTSLIEGSKAIYYKDKESLLVIAKDEAELNAILTKLTSIENYQTEFSKAGVGFTNNVASSLKCSDNTLLESCSSTKPKYCSVTNFDGTVSLVDKLDICGMPTAEAPILTIARTTDKETLAPGEQATITLTITGDASKVKNQVITSLADGIISGGEISTPTPRTDSITNLKDQILWLEKIYLDERMSASYKITAKSGFSEIKFLAKGEGPSAIYKKASNDLTESVNITGLEKITISSPQPPGGGGGGGGQPPAPVCNENWECANWGSCENRQRTRTCTDRNNCGTTTSKPQLTESCIACTDTDSGIDIFTTGTVTYQGATYTDTCNSITKKIIEYSCSVNDTMQTKEDDCAICSTNGKSCQQQFVGCTPACSQEQECVIPEGSTTGTCQAKTPETNLYAQLSSIETNRNHGYKGVVGKNAATTDSIGMVDIAGKFKISQTKSDDQHNLTNIQTSTIIVGGPCINTLARELKNKNKFQYGCADWPGGGNFSVAEFIPDAFGPGKNVIFIAGTRGEDTREMTQILKKYKDTDKESKFKAKKRVCTSLTPGFCQSIGLTNSTNTI